MLNLHTPMLESGLIARMAGDGDSIGVPLDFGGGKTRLGPVVIGPAPVLARRS